ncbi:MAG: alpha/beta hydrolase [Polyangiaceae bacterium]|nr:alpha/beta hydrolase [Polyangiaceae bacterium]
MRDVSLVFLAGLGNSPADHWQRFWFDELSSSAHALWVDHHDWNRVSRGHWVTELDAAIDGADAAERPIVFVAHSLGCLLAAEWIDENRDAPLEGALLVAPPDLSAQTAPKEVSGFRSPFSLGAFPCRTIVAASADDPFATVDFARRLADHWKARWVDVGPRGHINAESGLGRWPEGRALLGELLNEPARTAPAAPAAAGPRSPKGDRGRV